VTLLLHRFARPALVAAFVAAAPNLAIVHAAAPLPPLPEALATRLAEAEKAFTVQDWPRVIELADSLIGHPDLNGRPEHVVILERVGSAHWFQGSRDAARLIFGTLLRESPFHRLDEFIYPPELLDFYRGRRNELVAASIIPARPGEPLPEQRGPQRILVREVRASTTPAVVYLAPFGIGQFANDDDGKGTVFAVLQGIGVATMVATWAGIESLKVEGTNQIRPGDGGSARLQNALWYAGLGLFAATWTWSIVDGFALRRTRPVIDERFEFIDPEDPSAPSNPATLRLVPGPGEAGLGFDVRF
jgi:hypothetical protein